MLNKTIVASATPVGISALGIVRISGENAFEIFKSLIKNKKITFEPNTFKKFFLQTNENKIIDEAIVLFYQNPHSYTGEDLVEIIHHGNPLIAQEIIDNLIKNGAVFAEPGEFTKRAFLNKKINLLQAESVNELIHASNLQQKNNNLTNLINDKNNIINDLKKDILDLIAFSEVNIDYPEYTDLPDFSYSQAIEIISNHISKWTKIYESSKLFISNKNIIEIALIGEPNVGKSSILNCLYKEDKALVSNIKGTTRDVVEIELNIDGFTLKIYDTAGIRKTNDKLEKQGIKKTKQVIKKAEYIFEIFDNHKKIKLKANSKYFLVLNKSDLEKNKNYDNNKILKVSAKTKQINSIWEKINLIVKSKKNISNTEYFYNTKRQINIVYEIIKNLKLLKSKMINKDSLEFISFDLQNIYNSITSLTGETYQDQIIDNLFKNYCLGK